MSLYQRWLASSAFSLRGLLDSRARRLEVGAEEGPRSDRHRPAANGGHRDIDDVGRGRFEDLIAAITLSRNTDQVREEVAELRNLAR